MSKIGRNDPCSCGSGKKYKQCCLINAVEAPQEPDETGLERAAEWLLHHHQNEFMRAVLSDFFTAFPFEKLQSLEQEDPEGFARLMALSMEWLIAEGFLSFKRQVHKASDFVLQSRSLKLTSGQRQWIELLAKAPLSLYELESIEGENLVFRDLLTTPETRVTIQDPELAESLPLEIILAARPIALGDRWVLSDALYDIPKESLEDLMATIAEVRASDELKPEDVRFAVSDVIRDLWLDIEHGERFGVAPE
jgi:SEC-C motif